MRPRICPKKRSVKLLSASWRTNYRTRRRAGASVRTVEWRKGFWFSNARFNLTNRTVGKTRRNNHLARSAEWPALRQMDGPSIIYVIYAPEDATILMRGDVTVVRLTAVQYQEVALRIGSPPLLLRQARRLRRPEGEVA